MECTNNVVTPIISWGRYGRLNSLDKLKTLASFLIVCIHAPFPGLFGEYFTALTRIAVPIFFMISGFFYEHTKAKKQIVKIMRLFVYSNILYLLWDIGMASIKGDTLLFLKETFTAEHLLTFVFFNDTHLQAHLWYLGAILYVLLIVTALWSWNSKVARRALYLISPFLLLGDLMLGKYSILLWHHELPYVFARNWLFVGIPYFTLGLLLKERSARILNTFSRSKTLMLIIATSGSTILERILLKVHGVNATRDHYISTTFLAVFVFTFFLLHISQKDNCLSRIGRKYSTWIYISHFIIIIVLSSLARKIGVYNIYSYISPIICYFFTLFVMKAAMGAMEKFRKKRRTIQI